MNFDRHIAGTLGGMLICAGIACGQTPVNDLHTWTDPGLGGWTNSNTGVALSNPGGYLQMQFPKQTISLADSDTVRTNFASPFLPTNISFRFFAEDTFPSSLRLFLHSTNSGNSWYVILTPPATGVWTDFSVPVDYNAATWIKGSIQDEAEFQTDLLGADWIGIDVMRHGNLISQRYRIDDVNVTGITIPTTTSISGMVAYDGGQAGLIRVSAATSNGQLSVNIPEPGPFNVGNLPINRSYTLAAYRDSNNNGAQEFWEAQGAWTGNPVRVFIRQVGGINIAMTDPASPSGLPYWWLNQHFGITGPVGEGGGGDTYATQDPDGDRMNNWGEYLSGSDPTNFLSVLRMDIRGDGARVVVGWQSESNHSYALWRSESMADGFVRIQSGIAATPPRNEVEDPDAADGVPRYYRVQLE